MWDPAPEEEGKEKEPQRHRSASLRSHAPGRKQASKEKERKETKGKREQTEKKKDPPIQSVGCETHNRSLENIDSQTVDFYTISSQTTVSLTMPLNPTI